MSYDDEFNEAPMTPRYEEEPDPEFELQNKDGENNPLGLSDKDVQLEFDGFPPKSPSPSAETLREHPESPLNEQLMSPKVENQNGNEEEVDDPLVESIKPADDDEDAAPGSPRAPPDASAIFGSDHSDDEDDIRPAVAEEKSAKKGQVNDDDDENGSHAGSIKSDPGEDKISDFDIMMQKKSDERRRSYGRRKKQDGDMISDHDDRIQLIIAEMKAAAESDRRAHQNNECAIGKITMLPRVVNLLQKHDLQTACLDCGILSALADWLAPLPDGNLTHLKIRESILKILAEMSTVSSEQLKTSGIGKAVMLLYKHPKELKENRAKAGRLIQEWSRPIFGKSTNYRSMTREEREERDIELMSSQTKKRRSLESVESDDEDDDNDETSTPVPKKRRSDPSKTPEEEDPNKLINRARVPQPSLKDYVIRPKSQLMENAEGRLEGVKRSSGGKPQNRFERRMRDMKEQQRSAKSSKGQHVSLEGRKL